MPDREDDADVVEVVLNTEVVDLNKLCTNSASAEYDDNAEIGEVAFLNEPRRWPMRPFCGLLKNDPSAPFGKRIGVAYEGLPFRVLNANMWDLMSMPAEQQVAAALAAPVINQGSSWEEIVAAGWEVD